jgi:hypothetical protein
MFGIGQERQRAETALIVAQMHYRRWQGCIYKKLTQPHGCG